MIDVEEEFLVASESLSSRRDGVLIPPVDAPRNRRGETARGSFEIDGRRRLSSLDVEYGRKEESPTSTSSKSNKMNRNLIADTATPDMSRLFMLLLLVILVVYVVYDKLHEATDSFPLEDASSRAQQFFNTTGIEDANKNEQFLLNRIKTMASWMNESSQEQMKQRESIKELADSVTALKMRLGGLEKSVGEHLSSLESELSSFQVDQATRSVVDNVIHFGADERWLYLCNWKECTLQSQEVVLVELMKLLPPDKRRKIGKNKLRVMQIGSCSDLFISHILSTFQDRVEKVEILDTPVGFKESGDYCTKPLSASGVVELFVSLLHLFYDSQDLTCSQHNRTNLIVSERSSLSAVSTKYLDKYFDVLILDLHSRRKESLDELLSAWSPKLRNDGIAFGHGFGIPSSMVPVTWSIEPLTVNYLEKTNGNVSAFFPRNRETMGKHVYLAGDTAWYMFKRKISISDVFGGKP